ncbi:phase variable surface lipoprotein P78 precursor (plasmid) [Mesomycoplasma conjunctivae]|nr:lipoprotein 17-related variable surface protein [Mycoplasmopsis fermentans]VEU67021.1 phase variable surface lipoprotein P78 precursor [Mesomycoplasma conjunctivae]
MKKRKFIFALSSLTTAFLATPLISSSCTNADKLSNLLDDLDITIPDSESKKPNEIKESDLKFYSKNMPSFNSEYTVEIQKIQKYSSELVVTFRLREKNSNIVSKYKTITYKNFLNFDHINEALTVQYSNSKNTYVKDVAQTSDIIFRDIKTGYKIIDVKIDNSRIEEYQKNLSDKLKDINEFLTKNKSEYDAEKAKANPNKEIIEKYERALIRKAKYEDTADKDSYIKSFENLNIKYKIQSINDPKIVSDEFSRSIPNFKNDSYIDYYVFDKSDTYSTVSHSFHSVSDLTEEIKKYIKKTASLEYTGNTNVSVSEVKADKFKFNFDTPIDFSIENIKVEPADSEGKVNLKFNIKAPINKQATTLLVDENKKTIEFDYACEIEFNKKDSKEKLSEIEKQISFTYENAATTEVDKAEVSKVKYTLSNPNYEITDLKIIGYEFNNSTIVIEYKAKSKSSSIEQVYSRTISGFSKLSQSKIDAILDLIKLNYKRKNLVAANEANKDHVFIESMDSNFMIEVTKIDSFDLKDKSILVEFKLYEVDALSKLKPDNKKRGFKFVKSFTKKITGFSEKSLTQHINEEIQKVTCTCPTASSKLPSQLNINDIKFTNFDNNIFEIEKPSIIVANDQKGEVVITFKLRYKIGYVQKVYDQQKNEYVEKEIPFKTVSDSKTVILNGFKKNKL